MSTILTRPKTEDRVVAAFAGILATLLLNLVDAALAMWFLDCAHRTDARVPAFGFFTCAFLSLALTGVVTTALVIHASGKKTNR